mmetsp:Transcript_14204/g.27371  ORF Transcript_14204/g.27371 Transcript_14204/m.27371 type:complete len:239 (-) Transcript_14204:248-964(-)
MKDFEILLLPPSLLQSSNSRPLLVRPGVAAGGHDDHKRGIGPPLHLLLAQPSLARRDQDLKQVGPQPVHQHLALRVAESHVELQHLGRPGLLVDHEPSEDDPLERAAFLVQASDQGLDDRLQDLGLHLSIDHGSGAVGAHAARVGSPVAIVGRLVVLGALKRKDVPLGVDDHKVRCLLSREELLDDDDVARVPELLPKQHGVHGLASFVHRLRDNDAFPRRQSVRLHDHRRLTPNKKR